MKAKPRLRSCPNATSARRNNLHAAAFGQSRRVTAGSDIRTSNGPHRWHQVSQYADRLGYSARTLNRLARANTGLSAKQLIDERVVLEAKRQLSHANASVAEIAELLGFDDASNFSSYFRRHTGTTPAAFRVTSRRGG
jgi:AraC-like DNA-binding protein